MKPRKKISSATGAATTIRKNAAIAPRPPSSTPSSRVMSSCSGEQGGDHDRAADVARRSRSRPPHERRAQRTPSPSSAGSGDARRRRWRPRRRVRPASAARSRLQHEARRRASRGRGRRRAISADLDQQRQEQGPERSASVLAGPQLPLGQRPGPGVGRARPGPGSTGGTGSGGGGWPGGGGSTRLRRPSGCRSRCRPQGGDRVRCRGLRSWRRDRSRHLGQRGDVAAALAVEQQRPDAGGPAPATSSSRRVADVERLGGGAQPAISSACEKITGSGLREPDPAEVTTPSSGSPSPQRSSTSVSETSQFETQTSRSPRARRSASAGAASGYGAEADRGHHRLDRDLAVELRGEDVGAARAQGRERGRVVALVRVLLVVGHLLAHRAREVARRARRPSSAARCTHGGSSSTSVPRASRKTARGRRGCHRAAQLDRIAARWRTRPSGRSTTT